ncbi:hypothetical protein MAM1_0004c00424 [Mucor ambiguus]|uniref:Invertebrate defensins family profile domain-containing protein n=1 Tax=Mucor ambiguus TaxID=91626 RepID=A0A0C9LPR9_9FUNG|nr:hypothetical protein MAM1_0004c00424 [Mucor ambiguus]
MKLVSQLSALAAAALISFVSAAPGQKICHALSEAHANAVCKEYCGSTGYILGKCGSEGICICSNKTTTVKVHLTTPHASCSLTATATTTSKISTATSHHSTMKNDIQADSNESKRHSKSVSTIWHTRTNSKRRRSTKTTTTYKTVKKTITKTITMKASEVSALADNASSKSKGRLTTVYTTVSRHHYNKRPIRTTTAST